MRATSVIMIIGMIASMVTYHQITGAMFEQTDAAGSVIQWIVQQTGMGGIAALALVMLNKVWKDRVDAEKSHAAQINTLRSDTLTALQRNVEVITRLTEKLDGK